MVSPGAAHAATASVSVGTAGSYSVLGATAVTNTGSTTLSGDLGTSPATASSVTGFGPPAVVGGTVHQRKSFCVKGLVGASSVVCPCIAEWGWSQQRVIGLV
jgi:hypothetical protein